MWWWMYIPSSELGPALGPLPSGLVEVAPTPSASAVPEDLVAPGSLASPLPTWRPTGTGARVERDGQDAQIISPGTLGEGQAFRISPTLRALLPQVGRFFGPLGAIAGAVLNLVLPSAVPPPGASAPTSPAGRQATPGAPGAPGPLREAAGRFAGLTEAQVRDLARGAGSGDPEAGAAIEKWRRQMQAESAARTARIDALIADLANPAE